MIYGFDTAHSDSENYPHTDKEWIKKQCEKMIKGIKMAAKVEKKYLLAKTNEEKSVYDLIYKIPEFDMQTKKTLFCVGRLDRDTEGLLLVTNDGDLSNYLMRPDKHILKTYFVQTLKAVYEKDLKELGKGVLSWILYPGVPDIME